MLSIRQINASHGLLLRAMVMAAPLRFPFGPVPRHHQQHLNRAIMARAITTVENFDREVVAAYEETRQRISVEVCKRFHIASTEHGTIIIESNFHLPYVFSAEPNRPESLWTGGGPGMCKSLEPKQVELVRDLLAVDGVSHIFMGISSCYRIKIMYGHLFSVRDIKPKLEVVFQRHYGSQCWS